VTLTSSLLLLTAVPATIPPDPFIISEAAKGTYIEARNRRVLEDNRRQIAEAEQRQREFEEAKGRRG
jgi:hypothetical protein